MVEKQKRHQIDAFRDGIIFDYCSKLFINVVSGSG